MTSICNNHPLNDGDIRKNIFHPSSGTLLAFISVYKTPLALALGGFGPDAPTPRRQCRPVSPRPFPRSIVEHAVRARRETNVIRSDVV